MGHSPGFPCVIADPNHDGHCSTELDATTADRLRAAMAHHARGDALEFLGAPEGDVYQDETVWLVDDVAIDATVQDGQPWVVVNFPHQPDGRAVPEYVRQGPADVMERWLLAGLAAVHDARARASMEVS
jgi:hypothetical protein